MESFFSPGRIGDSFRRYYKSAVDKIYGKECNELENSEIVTESTPSDAPSSSDEEDDCETSPSAINFLSTPPETQDSDFRASYQELLVLDATSPGYVSRRVAEASRIGEFPAISLSLPTPPKRLHPVRLVGGRKKSIADDAEGTSFTSLSSLLGNRRESEPSQSPIPGATIDGGSTSVSPNASLGNLSPPVLGSGLPTMQKQFKTSGGSSEDVVNREGEEVMDFVHFGGRGGGIAEMMRPQLSPGIITSGRDRGNFNEGHDKLTMRRRDETRGGWGGSRGASGGESVLEALRTLSRKRINLTCLLGSDDGGSETVESKRPKGDGGWVNTQIIQMSSVQNKHPRKRKVHEKRFPALTGGSNEIQSSLSSSLGLRPPHLQVYLKRKNKFEEDLNERGGGGGRKLEHDSRNRERKSESDEDENKETGTTSNKKKKIEMEIESRREADRSFKEDKNKDGGEEEQSNISKEMGKNDPGNKEELKTIEKKKVKIKVNESLQESNSLKILDNNEKVFSESVKNDVNKTKERDNEDVNDEEDEPQLPPRKKTEIVEKVVTRPMVDALLKSAISKFVASGDIIQQAQRIPKEIQESKDEGDKAVKEGDSLGNQSLQLPETKEQKPIGGVPSIPSGIPGGGNVISLGLPQSQEIVTSLPSIVPTTQGGSPSSQNKSVGELILPGLLRTPEVSTPSAMPVFPTSPIVERQSGGGSGGGILGFTFGSEKPLGEGKEVKGSSNEAPKTINVSGGFNFGGTSGFNFGGSPNIQPGSGSALLNNTTPITSTVKSTPSINSTPSNSGFLFGSKTITGAGGEAPVTTCQPSGFTFGTALGKSVTTVTASTAAPTKQTPSLPFGFGSVAKPIAGGGGGGLLIGNPCTTAVSTMPVSPSPPAFAFGSSGNAPPSQQPPPILPLPPSFKFLAGSMATPPASLPSTGFTFAGTSAATTVSNPPSVPPLQTTQSSFAFGMGQTGAFGKGATTTSGILSPSPASLASPQSPTNPQFLFGSGTSGSIGGLGSKAGGGPGFTFGSGAASPPRATAPSTFVFGGGGSVAASGSTPAQSPSTSFTFGSSGGGASRGGGFSFNIASPSLPPSSIPNQNPLPPTPSSTLFGSPQTTAVPPQQQPTSGFLASSQSLISKPSLPQQSFTFGSGASFGGQVMPPSSSSSPALPSQPRVGSHSVFSFGSASQPTGQSKPPPQFNFEANAPPSAAPVIPGGGFASPQINPLQGMQPMFSIGSGSTAPRTRPLRSRRPR